MNRMIFLTLFIFLLTSNANSALIGSKHEFNYLPDSPCSYCHSVHHSVGGIGRPAYMGTTLPNITQVYTSSTLNHTITVAGVNNSDVPLCLSCHDGGFVESMNASTIKDTLKSRLTARPEINIGDTTVAGAAPIITNDHPVGFVFDETKDPGLKRPSFEGVHVAFGAMKNEMWCSSCHNPHDGTYPPLLATSNEGSALCLDCHRK